MGGEPTLQGASPSSTDSAAAKQRAHSVLAEQQQSQAHPHPLDGAVDGLQGALVAEQLGQEDRRKLLVVLESLDPAKVLQQQVSSPDAGTASLHQVLASPASLVPLLRTSINNAATSALFNSPDTTREALDAIDEYRRTALALLDELETKGKGRGIKRENEDVDIDAEVAPPTKKFMLHRGLGNMDIFTSAAPLNEAELAQLASANDTDVIAVTTGPKASPSLPETPAPTLGAIVRRPRAPAPPIEPPEPKSVELLYYDPYQSFAPSYDSSQSTLSYSQSTSHDRSRRRLSRWANDLDLVNTTPLPPPLPPTLLFEAPSRLELSETERQLLREVGVDGEGLEEAWENTEQQLKVWETIRSNGELLGVLIKGQRGRLRRAEGVPGPGESEATSRLYDSFASLLAARPRAPSNLRLVPSPSTVQSALPTLLASMTRDPAYQGTLEPTNQRAVRESAMAQADPAVAPLDQLMGGGAAY